MSDGINQMYRENKTQTVTKGWIDFDSRLSKIESELKSLKAEVKNLSVYFDNFQILFQNYLNGNI